MRLNLSSQGVAFSIVIEAARARRSCGSNSPLFRRPLSYFSMTSARNVAPALRSSEARTVAPFSSETASYAYRLRLGLERGLKPATTLGNNTSGDNTFPDSAFSDDISPDNALSD